MIASALLALVPKRFQHAAKAVVTAYAAVITAVVAAVPDLPRWLSVVVAVSAAVGVYQVPNITEEAGDGTA